tara:strand:- start:2706 stop:3362 length:657 start_codon:yes stop_codon:yes gene_type:complete
VNRVLGSLLIGIVLASVASSVFALPVNIPAIVPNLERASVLVPESDLAQPVMPDSRMDAIGLDIFAPRSSQVMPKQDTVDYVVVRKKERKLLLYAGDALIKSYPIALGKNPVGQKQREGDSRTPEGVYTLDWRNPDSRFYRSIHVNYPNQKQLKHARAQGIDPGGEIMIHGQPSDWTERIALTFGGKDWTEGCIAVENQAMQEIWNLVADNTLIEIMP